MHMHTHTLIFSKEKTRGTLFLGRLCAINAIVIYQNSVPMTSSCETANVCGALALIGTVVTEDFN